MVDKLDIIIFGASGFTGKYTAYEATNVLRGIRWGIAGRNKKKLEDVLKWLEMKTSKDLSQIPIIEADVGDENSLIEMAKKCKLIINCCGPFRLYGEPVVRACIEAGTHHVDVSGEPQYMEMMQLKYNELATKNNVYVISACGFDSIPCDLGVVFLEKNFDGTVNSVETYVEVTSNHSNGASFHYGTWESAVHGLANASELREIRTKLYTSKLPKYLPTLNTRPIIHKSTIIDRYCLPFPGSDRSVVMRSQRFLHETEKKRPVQMHAYIAFSSWFAAIATAFFGVVFGVLTKFAFGQKMLMKYPKIFSFGVFSHEGPSESQMESTQFSITLSANGWAKTENPSDIESTPPNRNLVAKVSGINPGYGATCVSLLCCAITILKENDKMPGSGGVLTPGAAFAKTNIIPELEKHERGIQFEILANK